MALTKATLIDLNSNELALDLDGDTTLHSSTDDQIDIKIAGADDFTFTANAFNALAGSHITLVDNSQLKVGADTDLQIYHDGTNSYIANKTGALKIATETSGIAITIGHTTSEVTIADNVTVTGNINVGGTLTFVDGSIAIADLDIDGGTDIGADIADADLFIVDDAAGGTNRKTAASRVKTYIGVPDMKVVGVWRLTAGQDLAVNGQVIANSWEEADNNYERTGSGVTESGGVFTVPESGKYLITASVQFNTASAQAYAGAYMQYTTNGSNFVTHAQMVQSVTDESAQQYASASTQLYLDATIAANYKVRLITTGATGTLSYNGNTNRNDTYIVFMKLADT